MKSTRRSHNASSRNSRRVADSDSAIGRVFSSEGAPGDGAVDSGRRSPTDGTSPTAFWCERKLVIEVRDEHGTTTQSFERPFAIIGSDPSADVCIRDAKVSPRRFYLHAVDDGIFCIDLTPLVEKTDNVGGWLEPGQWLTIGSTRIAARLEPAPLHSRPPQIKLTEREQATSSRPLIEVVRDQQTVVSRRVSRRLVLVGQKTPCRIRFDSRSISDIHCALYWDDRQLWVIDLLSETGTYFGGRRRMVAALTIGQSVEIGSYSLQLTAPPGEEASANSLPEMKAGDVELGLLNHPSRPLIDFPAGAAASAVSAAALDAGPAAHAADNALDALEPVLKLHTQSVDAEPTSDSQPSLIAGDEVTRWRREAAELETARRKWEAESAQLATTRAKLELEFAESVSARRRWQDEAARLAVTRQQVERELTEAATSRFQLESDNARCAALRERLERSLADNKSTEQRLQRELEVAVEAKTRRDKQAAKLEAERQRLEQEIAESAVARKRWEAEIEQLSAARRALESQLAEIERGLPRTNAENRPAPEPQPVATQPVATAPTAPSTPASTQSTPAPEPVAESVRVERDGGKQPQATESSGGEVVATASPRSLTVVDQVWSSHERTSHPFRPLSDQIDRNIIEITIPERAADELEPEAIEDHEGQEASETNWPHEFNYRQAVETAARQGFDQEAERVTSQLVRMTQAQRRRRTILALVGLALFACGAIGTVFAVWAHRDAQRDVWAQSR